MRIPQGTFSQVCGPVILYVPCSCVDLHQLYCIQLCGGPKGRPIDVLMHSSPTLIMWSLPQHVFRQMLTSKILEKCLLSLNMNM